MKTKRKPVVAWAVVFAADEMWFYQDKESASQAMHRSSGRAKLVKLVEHDPRKEAVVRAALKWLTDFEPLGDNRLVNAIERYRGRR